MSSNHPSVFEPLKFCCSYFYKIHKLDPGEFIDKQGSPCQIA